MAGPELLPPLRLPRSLLDPRLTDLGPCDLEGLVAVRLEHFNGLISAIHPWPNPQDSAISAAATGLPLAITPPVEPHAHLDKPFTAAAFANRDHTMAGAFAANGKEALSRDLEGVLSRGERALQLAWRHGLRAIRSHIDSLGPAAAPSWEGLTTLQQRWAGRLELQLVAMVPVRHWLTPAGEELAKRVAASNGGVLGGVIGPPFANRRRDRDGLVALLRLAERLGCPVDLHIDEGSREPGLGVALVCQLMRQEHSAVQLVCSHASSMSLLADRSCQRLCEAIAAAGIGVIALPTTNLWLLGRRAGHTPLQRIQAPIRQLQLAGVEVALGADNVQDPWYPGGAFDPIELLRLAALTSHVLPWQRRDLAAYTTVPARLLGLTWDGVLRTGSPADLLVLGADSWRQVLAQAPQRRVLRGGQWLPPPDSQSPSPLLNCLPNHQ